VPPSSHRPHHKHLSTHCLVQFTTHSESVTLVNSQVDAYHAPQHVPCNKHHKKCQHC
jgi:hypothetical protein